jgi:hypothetical protein
MRQIFLFILLFALLALPLVGALCAAPPSHPARAAAVRPLASAPKLIGRFDDWQAATHLEAGQTVCYALTRVAASSPKVPGRGDVVLTVTERTSGRDAVAISAGYAYPANAEVQVRAEQEQLSFYTAQRSAFARDGHAAVAAFMKARQAVARSPSLRGAVTDTFSLRGFSAAYAAIAKACPAK